MTREEAIKRLKEYAQYSYGIWHNDEEDAKAFDMAIEALSDRMIDRAELFNRLATIHAPMEANEYKAEVYKIINEL